MAGALLNDIHITSNVIVPDMTNDQTMFTFLGPHFLTANDYKKITFKSNAKIPYCFSLTHPN